MISQDKRMSVKESITNILFKIIFFFIFSEPKKKISLLFKIRGSVFEG